MMQTPINRSYNLSGWPPATRMVKFFLALPKICLTNNHCTLSNTFYWLYISPYYLGNILTLSKDLWQWITLCKRCLNVKVMQKHMGRSRQIWVKGKKQLAFLALHVSFDLSWQTTYWHLKIWLFAQFSSQVEIHYVGRKQQECVTQPTKRDIHCWLPLSPAGRKVRKNLTEVCLSYSK